MHGSHDCKFSSLMVLSIFRLTFKPSPEYGRSLFILETPLLTEKAVFVFIFFWISFKCQSFPPQKVKK